MLKLKIRINYKLRLLTTTFKVIPFTITGIVYKTIRTTELDVSFDCL